MATSKIKDRYMTIRLPADIEIELRKMADRNTRTLAAQILHCVKMEMERQQVKVPQKANV
jgi:predicted transcriptional regulator